MMPHLPHVLALLLLANGPASAATDVSAEDLVALVNDLRLDDCGAPPGTPPLRLDPALAAVAADFAEGRSLQQALEAHRDPATQAAGLRLDAVRLDAWRVAQQLSERFCTRLADPALERMASLQRGNTLWLVLADGPAARGATPARIPKAAAGAESQAEPRPGPERAPVDEFDMLAEVNEARSRPRQCGAKHYDAAPPLRWVDELAEASQAHARDMAERDYFDHVTPEGQKPTDRLARTGYRWSLTGENIARGEMSADEALQGWLRSPGHCANIMDARFTGMGFAVADGDRKGEVYWVQTFAAPQGGTEAR